jgi:hypothetical protein
MISTAWYSVDNNREHREYAPGVGEDRKRRDFFLIKLTYNTV